MPQGSSAVRPTNGLYLYLFTKTDDRYIQGWAKVGLQLFVWNKTCKLWLLQ